MEFVTANSKIKRDVFLKYMMATGELASDVGTVIYGREAVSCGLIDKLGSLGDALDTLHRLIERDQSRRARKRNGE